MAASSAAAAASFFAAAPAFAVSSSGAASAALAPLAEPESSHWVTMAIWLAIYAGVIQFLLGALRLE